MLNELQKAKARERGMEFGIENALKRISVQNSEWTWGGDIPHDEVIDFKWTMDQLNDRSEYREIYYDSALFAYNEAVRSENQ